MFIYQCYTLQLLYPINYIILYYAICGNHLYIKVILISSNLPLLQYCYNTICHQLYTKTLWKKVGLSQIFRQLFHFFFPQKPHSDYFENVRAKLVQLFTSDTTLIIILGRILLYWSYPFNNNDLIQIFGVHHFMAYAQ